MDNEYATILAELRSLRRRQNALLGLVSLIVLWLCGITFATDIDVALADRQTLPVTDHPFAYYFGLGHLPEDERANTARVLAFAVCSLNNRQVIEQQLPVEVESQTVYRIDTRNFGWEHSLPKLIEEHYPYSRAIGLRALVIRADWFIQFALDQNLNNQVYHELVFGKRLEKLDQFFAELSTVRRSPFEFGWIEDTSGVAVNRTRLIMTLPTQSRTDVWQTFDVRKLDAGSDPLEHLDRGFAHDASEIIGALPKMVASTGELGHLQVYALADAAGKLQTKAPADIVTDSTGIRGVEIRAAVSCIACHREGLRPLKVNGLRRYIETGAEVYADYDSCEAIQRFHLTDIQKLIDRHNVDYAAIVKAINGLTPEANSDAFQVVIRTYDEPLSLERAAAELWTSPDTLRLALAAAGELPARLAVLAHGQQLARSTWEGEYRTALAALEAWKGSIQ